MQDSIIFIKEDEMILNAEIINQPYSGQYKERVYDIPNSWNSQNWTWIRFSDEDFYEWCGEFRGSPINVALSRKYNQVLVLTSDYLYQIDCTNGNIIEYESQPQYRNLTVTPLGYFIVSDCYDIYLIESTLDNKTHLSSPVMMDMIEFNGWYNNKLLITCDEFMNWDNHAELELDGETLEITIKIQRQEVH